jgi:hypothetical protein
MKVRLDHPEKMRERRETVEHPFGTIKARMEATHFLMKTLPRVAAETPQRPRSTTRCSTPAQSLGCRSRHNA